MDPKEYMPHLTERQICAKLQHFWDILADHKGRERELNIEEIQAEKEIDELMVKFKNLFGDILYIP